MSGPYRTAAPHSQETLASLYSALDGIAPVTLHELESAIEALRRERIQSLALTRTADVPVPRWRA